MTITRSEVLRRSKEEWPSYTITYSQDTLRADADGEKYRTDCSGYVSMCWHTATSGTGNWGGFSTESFVTEGIMKVIPFADLKPGDAMGHCGPGSAGNGGHITLFLGWVSGPKGIGGVALIRDFGSTPGWKERTITVPDTYQAFRYTGIVDDPASQSQEEDVLFLVRDSAGQAWLGDGIRRRKVDEKDVPDVAYVVANQKNYLAGVKVANINAFGLEDVPGQVINNTNQVDVAAIAKAVVELLGARITNG